MSKSSEKTLLELSYENLINEDKIYSNNFWIKKIQHDMKENNLSLEEFLLDSCTKGRLIYVVTLIKSLQVNPSYKNNSAIISASKNGYIKIVEFLLGYDVNPSDQYNLAIIEAFKNNHINIIKLLLNDKRTSLRYGGNIIISKILGYLSGIEYFS